MMLLGFIQCVLDKDKTSRVKARLALIHEQTLSLVTIQGRRHRCGQYSHGYTSFLTIVLFILNPFSIQGLGSSIHEFKRDTKIYARVQGDSFLGLPWPHLPEPCPVIVRHPGSCLQACDVTLGDKDVPHGTSPSNYTLRCYVRGLGNIRQAYRNVFSS